MATVNPKSGPLAGQTFPSEYAYRKALAAERGYTTRRGYLATQRGPAAARFKPPTSSAGVERLNRTAQTARHNSFTILAIARDRKVSIAKARNIFEQSTGVSVAPETLQRHIGKAMEKRNGVWQPTARDNLYRSKWAVTTTQGVVHVEVRGSAQANLLTRYAMALDHWLMTGDAGPLQRFRGKRIGSLILETRLDRLRILADSGRLERPRGSY